MNQDRDAAAPPQDRREQAAAWCMRLAEGTLSDGCRRQFDQWLAADPENAKAFDQVTRTWESFGQAQLSPELIAMRRDSLDRFHRAHAARWNRTAKRRLWGSVAAAAAIVGICAGLWMKLQPEHYETAPGERRVVALHDGSMLSLDSRTRVEIVYSGQRRELQLKHGRAKFAVARDPLRPFSVTAADRVVVATGTEFSVELLPAQVHVVLYEGSVEVLAQPKASASREATGAPASMRVPGRELIAPVGGGPAEIRVVDAAGSMAWESGQLVFSDETLAAAVERVNRYTDAPLAIGDELAGRVRISGTFVAGDIGSFIEGITGVFPVSLATVDGRRLFVTDDDSIDRVPAS